MGNAGSVGDGGEEGLEGSRSSLSLGEHEDLMGQSPVQSPKGIAPSPPLVFAPQNPVMPLQKAEDLYYQTNSWIQKSNSDEHADREKRIPKMITWIHGGKEVSVAGSWDNWITMKLLQRSGNEFSIMKDLPSGYYQYRFVVDGEWKYAPEFPSVRDEMGNVFNVLDVQEHVVVEDVGSIAGFEPPPSPESSYNNRPLAGEDYTKEPPMAPPQLSLTILNTPVTAINNNTAPSLSRPPHVVLNHLYIQKGGGSKQPVVALGETCRFLAKHVTVVLYKSLD